MSREENNRMKGNWQCWNKCSARNFLETKSTYCDFVMPHSLNFQRSYLVSMQLLVINYNLLLLASLALFSLSINTTKKQFMLAGLAFFSLGSHFKYMLPQPVISSVNQRLPLMFATLAQSFCIFFLTCISYVKNQKTVFKVLVSCD